MNTLISLLPYIQIAMSVLLIILILLQRSEASLGSLGGGGDAFSSAHFSRRGFEKTLFNATILVACLFALSSLLALIV